MSRLGSISFVCKVQRNNTFPACLTEQIAPTQDMVGLNPFIKLDWDQPIPGIRLAQTFAIQGL